MSPRAACRLATLGFGDVYDYMPGKVDWIASGLPLEGEWDRAATVGARARRDVVTCGPAEPAAGVAQRIDASPYGFALVLAVEGEIVLGRLRRSAVTGGRPAAAGDLMDPGPSTVRAHVQAREMAERLRDRDLRTVVVTAPTGGVLGVVRREDIDSA